MEQPLISVIVPVYKVENTLVKCVESIKAQTYSNLEIILVDDGSPDKSGELCEQLATTDPRIKVLHKENGGLSSARNAGLDIMQGEYVGFVDSDDWIESDMYARLYALIQKHNAQISACGIVKDYDNDRMEYFNPEYPLHSEIVVFSKREALRENLSNTRITYSACDKLYHKSIFSSLRMTVGKIFEDMDIMSRCLELAETIVYDPVPFYHYSQVGESIIRGKFNLKRFTEADIALERAEDYKHRYPELYFSALAAYISICLNIIHKSKGAEECKSRRLQLIKDIRKKQPKEAIALLRKNDKIKYRMFRFSPFLYEIMMGLYDWRKGNR